jgi:hypothetical protein
MVPSDGGSFLTFALAAALWQTPVREPWLEHGTGWCWAQLEGTEAPGGYWVKFALEFLDSVPDTERALAAIERLRPALGEDGSLPVPGGTENERITALTLSPRPSHRSRILFEEEQIADDLDELEDAQGQDGGWTFDHLAWSPGQSVEWRGIVTLQALGTLLAHERIERPPTRERA